MREIWIFKDWKSPTRASVCKAQSAFWHLDSSGYKWRGTIGGGHAFSPGWFTCNLCSAHYTACTPKSPINSKFRHSNPSALNHQHGRSLNLKDNRNTSNNAYWKPTLCIPTYKFLGIPGTPPWTECRSYAFTSICLILPSTHIILIPRTTTRLLSHFATLN